MTAILLGLIFFLAPFLVGYMLASLGGAWIAIMSAAVVISGAVLTMYLGAATETFGWIFGISLMTSFIWGPLYLVGVYRGNCSYRKHDAEVTRSEEMPTESVAANPPCSVVGGAENKEPLS